MTLGLAPLVLGIVVGVVAVLAGLALFRRQPPAENPAANELRSEMHSLRDTTENMSAIFASQLNQVSTHVQAALANATGDLGGRLEAINRQVTEQLNQSANQVSANTNSVAERIAAVQNTFAGLQKQVGEMTEQARQLTDLSRSVTAIEHVLRAPKMRGSFGEEQLENLLGLVFARQQYDLQYRFPSGEVADAIIFLPLGSVAIDSKFPLENFRRIPDSVNDEEKKPMRRDFLRDVRKRVDEIATRYIRPAEGTLPFALMYVPAENVYYETIIRDDDGYQLYRYCLEKRVVPVSPNSLYAYLQTIMVGMKGLQVSQRAELIVRGIESLKIELEKFGKAYETIGQHVRNAAGKFDEGSRLLTKVEARVESLTGQGPDQPELFEEKQPPALK
ncbi:MAG TPA: DNA recombination protein RmuC [Candidatus Saccharimonadales bacterium]|jgi:DNA recombination protein RmuC|nr:DNA recombination protein RmuC [Candidatus Saccharimonadales bacterium]